jgi:hypothetical protein
MFLLLHFEKLIFLILTAAIVLIGCKLTGLNSMRWEAVGKIVMILILASMALLLLAIEIGRAI